MKEPIATSNGIQARDQVGGLIKGLKLIEAFDSAHTRMTLSEAARRVGITPAAARRCLLTLCHMGYAQTDGKLFWLGHGALRVAYAYTASTRLPRILQPALDALSERTRESATLGVLDGHTAIIAGRSTARRTLMVGLTVGSRLPLYCSAAGRALLASMERHTRDELLRSIPLVKLTQNTVVTLSDIDDVLQKGAENGYYPCDEEIELGVRSIAIPLYDEAGTTVAAMSISTRTERMTIGEMADQLLPTMLRHREWARTRVG